jgi:integrase
MKTGREHGVPLSKAALSLLKGQRELAAQSKFVFPGSTRAKSISNMAMLQLLRRIGRDDLTVHGFRSTFRDWAAECTAFPNEVAEAALARVVGDKVEAAYRRGDLFEKRRRLMANWAAFYETAPRSGAVVPIRVTSQL